MLNEPKIDLEAILEIAADAYSLDIACVEFVPKGEVAWCYKLTDNRNRAFLLRIAPGAPAASMASIEKLKGLDFIVTPVDNLILGYDDYSLSLYDFIAGETMWERTPNAAQMEVAGRCFARLHRTAQTAGPFEKQETFSVEFSDTFDRCIERLRVDNATSASHEASLREKLGPFIPFILDEYGRLLAQRKDILKRDVPFMNCHGDPSPLNIILTGDRVYLIDLDDLVYAPKEKDLLYFSDQVHFDKFMDGYRSIYPQAELDVDLRAFYGRTWFLGEMTEHCTEILDKTHTADEYAHYLQQVDEILEDVGLK